MAAVDAERAEVTVVAPPPQDALALLAQLVPGISAPPAASGPPTDVDSDSSESDESVGHVTNDASRSFLQNLLSGGSASGPPPSAANAKAGAATGAKAASPYKPAAAAAPQRAAAASSGGASAGAARVAKPRALPSSSQPRNLKVASAAGSAQPADNATAGSALASGHASVEHLDGRVSRTIQGLQDSSKSSQDALEKLKQFLASPPKDDLLVLGSSSALNHPRIALRSCLSE